MNIAFIPVRGGSKSIPLKNIKLLNGKPLVYWTALAAENADCIDKVVIATDSTEIKSTVLSFGFKKLEVYDRNPNNAQDTSSTESVMLEYIEKSELEDEDLFFLIQATSPMLKSEHIDGMFNYFKSSECDSMFSGVLEKQFHWRGKGVNRRGVNERGDKYGGKCGGKCVSSDANIPETGVWEDVVPVNYDYKNRPRRQDFEGLIAENGACYINSVKNIREEKCRISGKIGAYELPSYTAYEIDEPEDWIIVEELMKRF